MTAVEWLIHQYIKDGLFTKGVYEQAIEMEKQQKLDFAKACSTESAPDEYYEEVYNETFKKD